MKLIIPFSLIDHKNESDYFQHRLIRRFLYQMGDGIRLVAMDHARTIAKAQMKAGKEISHSINEGFSSIEQHQRNIHHALIDQNQILRVGFDSLELSLEKGFERTEHQLEGVSTRLDHVRDTILVTQDRLEQGLTNLKASLDMGMMNIVSQFELQRNEIKKGFDLLSHILENQQKIAAQERFLDGKKAYETYLKHPEELTFLLDAEEYLQKSLTHYKGNPFCHLYLGHIYQEPTRLFNLDRAFDHYKLSAIYAKGIPNPDLAALGYFMASWIAFINHQVSTAIELGEYALAFDAENIPEIYFNLAKFHAFSSQAERAIHYLDIAIHRFDPLYSLKADQDSDFNTVRNELTSYFKRIRDNAAVHWRKRLHRLGVDHLLES